jgi:hypothetical protein
MIVLQIRQLRTSSENHIFKKPNPHLHVDGLSSNFVMMEAYQRTIFIHRGLKMDDVSTYQIIIRGHVDEAEVNAQSPLELAVAQAGPGSSCITIHTDQSGLIGLLRHLHGLGFVLLSVKGELHASEN